MASKSEFEEPFDNPIPEKCRDCMSANLTVAILSGFESSTGGSSSYLKAIEEHCPGYDIDASDAAVNPSDAVAVEIAGSQYIAFPVPSRNQLARCALELPPIFPN